MRYDFEADHGRRIVRVTLRAAWTPETFATFQLDLDGFVQRLRWAPMTYSCLVDSRPRGIQPKEMTKSVQEALTQQNRIMRPRRQAVLVASVLAKLQAERLNGAERAVFLSEDEALDWLSAVDDEPPS